MLRASQVLCLRVNANGKEPDHGVNCLNAAENNADPQKQTKTIILLNTDQRK